MTKNTIQREQKNLYDQISYPSIKLGKKSHVNLPGFRLEIQFASYDRRGFARAINVKSSEVLGEVEIPTQKEQYMQANNIDWIRKQNGLQKTYAR